MIANIHLPTASNGELSFNLERLTCNFLSDISDTCFFHLQDIYEARNNFDFSSFKSNTILTALVVMKKRAKRAYRKIDHTIVADICDEINDKCSDIRIKYLNNHLIDNSHLIDSDCSDDSVSSLLPLPKSFNHKPQTMMVSAHFPDKQHVPVPICKHVMCKFKGISTPPKSKPFLQTETNFMNASYSDHINDSGIGFEEATRWNSFFASYINDSYVLNSNEQLDGD